MWSDDGIAIRLPDSDAVPPTDLIADRRRTISTTCCSSGWRRARCSPPASARTRRARCCCRGAGPGQRTPLWQQRLKAHDLQQVAKSVRIVPDHARDLPRGALRRVRGAAPEAAAGVDRDRAGAAGRGRVERSRRRLPARCCSTTSRATCTRATRPRPSGGRRRSQLDRALLAELLAADDLRELLDAEAIAEVEAELQGDRPRA